MGMKKIQGKKRKKIGIKDRITGGKEAE